MADTLKPQFYVLRPNNVAIPLIPMDELPHNIRVEGVPRVLTMEDVMVMKGIGKVEPRHQTYHVYDTNKTSSGMPSITQTHVLPQRPPTPAASASGSDCNTAPSRPPSDTIFPGPRKFYGIQEQKPDSDDETNISNQKVEASSATEASSKTSEVSGKHDTLPPWKNVTQLGSRLPPPGKKVYCSHWMSTGECDYAQQGCLYKHEMPLDIEMLNHLGFQDIPKWYRERHNIGKLTAVPGSGAHIRGSSQSGLMQSNWRSTSSSAVSAKGSRGPTLVPMSRANIHAADMKFPRRPAANGTIRTSRASRTKGLFEHDLLTTAPPSPSIKPTSSLLNSKYAPMTPLSPAAPNPTRSGSDADISVSSTAAQTGSPSNTAPKMVPMTGRSARVPASPRSKWKSFAANSTLSDSASEYMTSQSRRSSVISDYEAKLERENLKRDMAEAAEYAEVVARHKSQEEQASLARMQEHAIAAAKEKLRESVYEKSFSPVAQSSGRKKAARGSKGKVEVRNLEGDDHVARSS
ncbi:hypothetical protein LTR70_001262 [Exophiala xenobiotica]|uniref:C3H1-type domain-containing protein n=1 Tax=Lithohypha guttulata TaxID=1690604 RepID=A0ABR0KKJ8_9EURO|nr:hypothetical protein LTR24_001513 [Lithohypha guttulata]KAK5328237.1 hypothetical protein LTR70_001262 [Exophiala xenobiotica]